MLKKTTATLITASFLITTLPIAAYALPNYTASPTAPQVLKQIQFTDISNHWAKSPIIKMAAQGIIKGVGNNKYNPEGTLTKEQAIILLIRALGEGDRAEELAEALANQAETKPKNMNDFLIQGYLNTAQELGILTDAERLALEEARTTSAQRQEVAYWTAKALGLQPVYGTAQKVITGYKDSYQIEPAYLAWIESMLQQKLMSGTAYNVFNPKGSMKRSEMAALLDRVNPQLAGNRNIQLEDGYLMAKSNRREGASEQTVYEIKTDSGNRFELLIGGSAKNNVIVYKNGKTGNASLLTPGDRLHLYLEPNNQISFIEAQSSNQAMLFGQLKDMDLNNSKVTVTDYNGKDSTFTVAKGVSVVIDNRPAGLNDLVIGQDLTLDLKNNAVSSITGTFGEETPGYTPPQSGVRTGRIKAVDSDSLVLLNDNGQQEEYYLANNTWLSKNGTWKNLNQLQVGDRVKLHFNNLASRTVEKIDISSHAGKIVRVVRGRLEQVYPDATKLALSGVKEFFHGQWYPAQGFDLVDLVPDTEIYAKGQMLTANQLGQNFRGEDVYLAFTSNYGKNEGVKLVVKDGEARTYSDSIDEIDFGSSQFVLDNENLRANLNPGTIVLRGNKLVDRDDLEEDDHVFLETNNLDRDPDSIIVATANFYPKEFEFYRGRIDSVDEDEYELNYFSRFSGNEWDRPSSRSRDVDLSFNFETDITDTTIGRSVTPAKFAESRWSEYYDDDYYIYAVTQDDQTLAMTIWDYYTHPDVLKTTLARVTRVDNNTDTIDLDRLTDWSEPYDEWVPNNFPLSLDLSQAILYKDDQPINVEEIKPGDTIYVIHDQLQGVIAFIQ